MRKFLEKLVERFTVLREELNTLDAAVGDGDHGDSMCRGLHAALEDAPFDRALPAEANFEAVLEAQNAMGVELNSCVESFRREVGGVSGEVFSILLTELLRAYVGRKSLFKALTNAVEHIEKLGNVSSGDKTMFDSLVAASEVVYGMGDHEEIDAPVEYFAEVSDAAREGAEATRDMLAKRGRARALEHAGKGHIDPGAVSVAEILDVYSRIKEDAA